MTLPPFTPIETERLILRHFRESDVPAFYAYRKDPDVARYQGWEPENITEEAARERVADMGSAPGVAQSAWFQVAVAEKASQTLIGDIGLRLQMDVRQAIIGYTFASSAQGKGYATEAVSRLLDYLFDDIGVHRVMADALAANGASIRLMERLGFRHEGYFREAEWFEEEWADMVVYATLAREWRERKAHL